mmetsp:Transcript_118041/g.329012  ORF Transcript_118041/g.329012 Transcript_118041/m.329012 type:complete len:568 (+) Transcript_118041:52-1755(+)|eukprot:CAMPEP_0179170550 /NCGR_PEP_ID=MMETSP0796-20121207/84029_1 /TAXON_ID=73915 /ORGANISM="Pyrodinium bahamense, Strain pbaha01" /LENGTH=567 /DNA_ID=CAMNT_0020873547 /DNA_START=36 /DNA_END=1739 /DNA_ORIENTATION=-
MAFTALGFLLWPAAVNPFGLGLAHADVRSGGSDDTPYQQPEQIHIGFGTRPGEMTVHWTTIQESIERGGKPYSPGDSYVMFGLAPEHLSTTSQGYSYLFHDYGSEKRNYTMHIAVMRRLVPNTAYHYVVGGNCSGWSAPFRFISAPVSASDVRERLPMTYAIYGDQGDYNAQTLPSLQDAARRQKLDMVLHVGDMAYDLDSDNGRNGDAWMRDVEPLAATVPYMVSLGNHEAANNFNHYTQRFRNMPSNSGNISFGEFGTVPNNWWYSWESGLVHFVALSTEVYFDYPDLVPVQYAWLLQDLAAVDRTRTPWVIAHGHRPLYCSCDGDCDGAATTNRMGLKQSDGSFKYGLEHLFYEHGVDLYIAGHEHDYERMFDVAPHYNAVMPWLSGITTRSTADPPATTYMVTGSAGNIEDHEPFLRPAPRRSAKRLNTYGWSKMTVYNSTHVLWQQVQTDAGAPASSWGKVMDEAWIVQRHHGPFAKHPRSAEISAEGLSGLPLQSMPGDVDDSAVEGHARRLPARRCWHTRHGEPACNDQRLAARMQSLGRWQFTKIEGGQPSPDAEVSLV